MVKRPASISVEVLLSESVVEASEWAGGDALGDHLRLLLLVDLVRRRQISPKRAANEAGMGLLQFYGVLKEHRVPALDLDPDEFEDEVKTVERILAAS